ncbi:tripartite tricarboxylate transporter substrate binding protein [Phreatobacter aquaticus]|uniref:Tripartite tricarboxylate transporter substrate binding protein n=1 Tax=Phreatobacter aquaticus TaxID=2570229 RepID=A0A4D7QJ66_9HYPH|nr:tripartite tricarboxylate transporter substrate binding protein [Phreatobacter aquaticus]QCK87548.1 tripartite tricarboxylate transporter substrate binding protein [Phreatobacter aquaticus]
MFHISRRSFAASLSGLAGALASPSLVQAQAWPSRAITLVVPFPAGASTDIVARLLAEKLRVDLGQGVVVENKVGAGGNLAASSVVRAAPDGYTLFVSSSGPLVTNKLLYKSLSFDPLADFEPIALLGDVQLVVATHPSLPVTSLAELIAYGKANPGKLTFGIPGFGLMGHIAGELIQRTAGFQMTTVPYRGSAPLTNDLIAGNVNVSIDFLPTYLPHIESKAVRGLAVTADIRATQAPAVPTLSEAGLPGIAATSWFGLAGPKGLPKPIVDRLAQLSTAFMTSAEAKARFEPIGVRTIGQGPEALRAAQLGEIAKWEGVIRAANISLE